MTKQYFLKEAMWIWPRNSLYLSNSYAGFRYDFDMETLPETAPFLITADQSYKLHVNGRYVCRGPMRGLQENWYFDEVDLLPFLKPGHNWIAIEAHNPGKSTFYYLHKDMAGMICSASWDNGTKIFSNVSSWQIFRNTAYNHNTAQLTGQMGRMEELDLRFDERSWITQEKDYTLPPVMKGVPPTSKIQGALPWTGLIPRSIPLLDETCRAPEKVTSSGRGTCAPFTPQAPGIISNIVAEFYDNELKSIEYDSETIPFRKEEEKIVFTLPAAGENKFTLAVIDLGADTWLPGVPLLEFGPHSSGTVVDILYNQYMPDGKISFAWNPSQGSQVSLASRLHLNGKTDAVELFQIMGVRHVTLLVRETAAPLEVKLSWRSAVYPLDIRGKFSCSDPLLNKIYDLCVHTQRVCALDAYVDTPWREQSQWWGDARVQAKNCNFLTGDARLLQRGIRSIAEQSNPLGLTYANAPTSPCGPVLPDFCLTWIITLRDYWFQTKDTSLLRRYKPQAESILAYFENIRGSNGLIQYDPRFWLFEDWSTLPKRNTPCFINLWYIYACERYQEVLQAAGFDAEARELSEKIQSRKALAGKLFFDPAQQLFLPEIDQDGQLTGPASVHDQVLALLLDLVPEARNSMLQKVIIPCLQGTYATGAQPSSFWATYLLDCAQKYGLRREALAYIKRQWEPMLPAGTVWENFPRPNPGELSCAHAWSAHLISHLPELVFGFKQVSAGWEDLEFDSRILPELSEASFCIPLPQGSFSLRYTDAGKEGVICHSPEGVRVVSRNS